MFYADNTNKIIKGLLAGPRRMRLILTPTWDAQHSRENPTANEDTEIITCCTIVALQLLLLLLPLATLLLMMAHWFNMTKWILMWIYCV